jgi:hypothetical protein
MKRIIVGYTYDTADCATVGYRVEIMRRRTGQYHIVYTYRSRWQGNDTDVAYMDTTPYATVEDARRGVCECDPHSEYVYQGYAHGYVRLSRGYTVQ